MRVVILLGLILIPTAAYGQFRAGDWELTLGGAGSNDRNFNDFSMGLSAGIGYFLTNNLELSLRESLVYSDVGGNSSTTTNTHAALDFHLPIGRFEPFAGVQGGYDTSEIASSTFEAGPEVGLRAFVNPTTFVYVIGEYDAFFDTSGNSASNDGQFVYRVGIGVRF